MKRYLLFFNKKHFGKIITCCNETVFTEMHHALNAGEAMRDKEECLDYNVAIVYCPQLKMPEEEKSNATVERAKDFRQRSTPRPVVSL